MNKLFLYLFLFGEIVSFLLNEYISFSTYFYKKSGKATLPEFARKYIDESTEKKSDEYYKARFVFSQVRGFCLFIFSLLLVFLGYYTWLYNLLEINNLYIQSVLFLVLLSVPGELVDIPFSLYGEFVIEKKFGFSNTSFKLWISDLVKNTLIEIIMSLLLYGVLVFILMKLQSAWWYVAGTFLVIFSLLLTVVYPIWIAPLFNKFVPLEEGSLRCKLEKLLSEEGFSLKKVFVVDESKRSNHSNAYCSGFGRNKRIVLYDSLIKTLDEDEIVAVFAHELGHAKKKHIIKRLLSSFALLFVVLYLASLLLGNNLMYTTFGFEYMNPVVGLFLVFLIFGSYPSFLSWIGNIFSRRDEREADMFAKEKLGSGEKLASALMKLQKQNLSNTQPSKVEVFFRYSHPTVYMRVEYLLED
ncbi:MAG: M48 family metallopeptidase [Sphaerochaetaceae bacterium]|nr:M48 family metallopeptidase [Sphaerochaetaceae bacterium]